MHGCGACRLCIWKRRNRLYDPRCCRRASAKRRRKRKEDRRRCVDENEHEKKREKETRKFHMVRKIRRRIDKGRQTGDEQEEERETGDAQEVEREKGGAQEAERETRDEQEEERACKPKGNPYVFGGGCRGVYIWSEKRCRQQEAKKLCEPRSGQTGQQERTEATR
jgi:hypothetical protein